MRCEHCPAMQNVGGYEYPEYRCVVRDEDDIREFKSGGEGCLLRPPTIEKRLARLDEETRRMYAEEDRRYILTCEIESNPAMRTMCIDAMKHAIGLTGSCSQRHRPYRRHGKLFYKPWRNYYATSRSTKVYQAWKKLHYTGLAACSSADDVSRLEEQDMQETLWYTVTPKGLKWLQAQLEKDNGEAVFIRGVEK